MEMLRQILVPNKTLWVIARIIGDIWTIDLTQFDQPVSALQLPDLKQIVKQILRASAYTRYIFFPQVELSPASAV